MEKDGITVEELELRWKEVLDATLNAVQRHPDTYRALRSLAEAIERQPLDIRDYLPTARKLTGLLRALDPGGGNSLFHHFEARIAPTSIWHVNLFRMECRDLLDHLSAFDEWRAARHGLRIVK